MPHLFKKAFFFSCILLNFLAITDGEEHLRQYATVCS